MLFFLNEEQWSAYQGKIPKKSSWALSGAFLGLLVWAAVWKWVWEALKAEKAECVGMGIWGAKIGQKPKKSFFSEKAKWVLSFKKKIGSLALLVGLLAQVECRADFRIMPKIALGGIFAWFRVKIKQNSKSTTEITRRATELIFFLNEAQWSAFPGKIPKNQVWALSGPVLGLLVERAARKWVWEAEKTNKHWHPSKKLSVWEWACGGPKSVKNRKKVFFRRKQSQCFRLKKKLGP